MFFPLPDIQMKNLSTLLLYLFLHIVSAVQADQPCELTHPISKINILAATKGDNDGSKITATPSELGLAGQTSAFVSVSFFCKTPSIDDWIAVFSPAKFLETNCEEMNSGGEPPLICRAPIKFQYANYSNPDYATTGTGSINFLLVNQRSDFSFALFAGGLSSPRLLAISNTVDFSDPKAPVFARLALGNEWNEMTVTWTSGYGVDDAEPFVEYGLLGGFVMTAPAGTLTYDRKSMCDEPARTTGWRDPGFFHTSFLKDLWPNQKYSYRLGHRFSDGRRVYSQQYQFRSSPYPGHESVQRIVFFGSMGTAEVDGSTEMDTYRPGSLNTTLQLINDLKNIDAVFHIGDLSGAQGFLSQWDHFTSQIEPLSSSVPYMVASGNLERDWPNSGSFYSNKDSGGECGVPAESMFFVPSRNRAKRSYSADYGMFRFCVADSEHDWREKTEQYRFLEQCLSSVDRRKQPWLIFLAHRELGYSSEKNYALQGSFGEPMGRDNLEKLLQKHKVDIAMFAHSHHYERTCPTYEGQCTDREERNYNGMLNGTINVVVGGGGAPLSDFSELETTWSLRRVREFGFAKMTAMNHSSLLFEYKRSSDGEVVDSFSIQKEYRDILACSFDSCGKKTLAT